MAAIGALLVKPEMIGLSAKASGVLLGMPINAHFFGLPLQFLTMLIQFSQLFLQLGWRPLGIG